MLSKKTEQFIRSLSLKKFRQKYNNFIIEGDKMVRELLEHANLQLEGIYALPGWIKTNTQLLKVHEDKITEITERELKKISCLKTPNQVLVVAKMPTETFQSANLEGGLSLYLDQIQNPGNLGTILRTADWFGIDWVVCSMDCADLYSPKVVQATMGAWFRVKVVRKDFGDFDLQALNLTVYGAILGGVSIFELPLTPTGMIVIGNEGQGLRPEIRSALDHKIAIPSYGNTGTESLNAAVATSIICTVFRNIKYFN